jgi:hypothetical protein
MRCISPHVYQYTWNYTFDGFIYTSETCSSEHATLASAESYNDIKNTGLDAYATNYHVADTRQNSLLPLDKTAMLISSGSIVHKADITHEAYISLTHQALQQHNTENTLSDRDKITQCSLPQSHGPNSNLWDAVLDISTLAGYDHASVEPYFYPRRCSQLYVSTVSRLQHEYGLDNDIETPYQSSEAHGLHQYPVLIHPEFNQQTGEDEFNVEPLSIKQELFQATNSSGDVLVGVGTWALPRNAEDGYLSPVGAPSFSDPLAGSGRCVAPR